MTENSSTAATDASSLTTANTNTGATSGNRTNRSNQTQGSGSGYRGRNDSRSTPSYRTTPTFKGETPGMNGNVFEIHSEQRKKGQFQESMDALKVYASTTYKKDIQFLTPMFTNLDKTNGKTTK